MLLYPKESLPPIYNYDPGYKQYQWGLVTALKLRIQELCFLSSHVSSRATTYPRFMASTRVCLPFVLCHPTTRFSTPHSLSREPETMHSIFQLCLPSVTAVTTCLLWQDEDFTLLPSPYLFCKKGSVV